jgi:hypothetical protein
MIRSPAGFDGEIRIKRYMDYYQASYGVMMLSSGQFGAGTAAGYLLGSEPSGYATDFTAGGVQGNALVRSSPRNTQMDYSGTPFLAQGGPVTFSRGSLATVTDSDGYINWAQHNLLLASEQFDTTSWTKSSATVAANSIAAPDNAVTADTIAASGANGTVLQSYTAVAVPYVFGVWLRRKTGAGNIQIAADNGTYTTVTITNDWALYTVTQTPTAGTKSAGIRIVTSGDEVYAWGAHLYRSDLGGMQANASAYPMYNPSTPKNLLGFTELLTTGWTNTNTTDTQVAVAAPNGSANSIDVAATAGNGTLLASLSLLASPYTFSIWLRRKTGTGTVEITVDGTTYVTAAVTAGWQRFSTTLTPTAGTRTPGIRIVTSGDAVYAWGAQLSDSASLDPYTPNFGAAPSAAAAHGPRLDYDPSTLAPKGLLVEEQRTNILLQSNTPTVATWIIVAATPTANTTDVLDPAGTNTSTKVVFGGASSAVLQPVTSTAVAHTASIWLRTASGTASIPFTLYRSSPFAAVATTTLTVTSTWQRFTLTGTFLDTTAHNFQYGTNTSATIYSYGAQLEVGSFVTSYIPTAAATVTRNADVASVGVSQFPYSATEGSIVANVTPLNVAAARRAVQIDDGTENERYTLSTNSTPNGLFTVIDGGSSQAAIATGTPAANTNIKLAARYKVNDFALSVNGGAASTDTSGTLPIANLLMRLGSGTSSTEPLNGHIRQITYIPRALTNAELIARST